MQDSLKAENTPTHHRREYNISVTTQASFPAKFKITRSKIGQKRQRCSVSNTLCAQRYIIKYR